MKTGFALIGLAASLASLGCVAADGDLKAQAAAFSKTYGSADLCLDVAECRAITVTVGEGCRISVSPWTFGVPTGQHNVKLRWVIDPASAGNPTFAADGIFFKAGQKEFDSPGRANGNKHFMWNDKNPKIDTNRPRPFPYGIKVIQYDKACPTLDPTVVNDF